MRTDRNVIVNFTNSPKICSCGPSRTKVRFRSSFQINLHIFRDSTFLFWMTCAQSWLLDWSGSIKKHILFTWKKIPVVALNVVQQQFRWKQLIGCVTSTAIDDHDAIQDGRRVEVFWSRLRKWEAKCQTKPWTPQNSAAQWVEHLESAGTCIATVFKKLWKNYLIDSLPVA